MDENPDKKTIIVVEDSEQIADLVKTALNDEPDYQATVAPDGAVAIEVVRSVKASLVLLDINLPGMDGLQLYDLLQEDPETRDIPVIFITADGDNPGLRERGIKDHIAKPFDLNDLLSQVAAVCRADQA